MDIISMEMLCWQLDWACVKKNPHTWADSQKMTETPLANAGVLLIPVRALTTSISGFWFMYITMYWSAAFQVLAMAKSKVFSYSNATHSQGLGKGKSLATSRYSPCSPPLTVVKTLPAQSTGNCTIWLCFLTIAFPWQIFSYVPVECLMLYRS